MVNGDAALSYPKVISNEIEVDSCAFQELESICSLLPLGADVLSSLEKGWAWNLLDFRSVGRENHQQESLSRTKIQNNTRSSKGPCQQSRSLEDVTALLRGKKNHGLVLKVGGGFVALEQPS